MKKIERLLVSLGAAFQNIKTSFQHLSLAEDEYIDPVALKLSVQTTEDLTVTISIDMPISSICVCAIID
jgi:hypothetical protein